MRIGELAELSGLAASRIRFYESQGLIQAVRRKSNGYRDYAPEAMLILEIIGSAQSAGFSLEQVRHLLPMGNHSWDHTELLKALRQKVTEIEALQKHLKESRTQLLVAIESIENKPADTTDGSTDLRDVHGAYESGDRRYHRGQLAATSMAIRYVRGGHGSDEHRDASSYSSTEGGRK